MTDRGARRVRACAAVAGAAWAASAGLLWWQRRAGEMHPAAGPFVALLALTLVPAIYGMVLAVWRAVRGPNGAAAAGWGLACVLPLAFWAGLSALTLRLAAAGEAFRRDPTSDLAAMTASSLMEGAARWGYPHRLESDRLVMFYDDRVTDPHRDIAAMDRHVAALEAATGRPLRVKLHWVRGAAFGRGRMAIRGLALGSDRSPADWDVTDDPFGPNLDRHELAHGVMHQLQTTDADAPTLLIEGWAEAHCGWPERKRAEVARDSRRYWRERTGAGPERSYLRDLTGPDWYHKVDGPVYSVGGALAGFVVREYGTERFLRLYSAARPGRFAEAVAAELGVPLDALEAAFWADVERLAGPANP